MELALKITQMVAPVIAMIGLGCLCRKKQYIDHKGLAGLKGLIGNITLPAVLFNAFLTASYSMRVLLVFAVVYVGFGIALGFGFLTRRFVKPYDRFMPFLLSSAEGGMLGYALFALIGGSGATSVFATVDIGQTMFAYTVYLSALKITDGQKTGARDVLAGLVSNKACLGMAAGIILGVSGAGSAVLGSQIGGIVTSLINFITAPTAGVILIVVGYELELRRELMAGSAVIFAATPFDKELFMAMLLMYALPAPFIIPLFADTGEDGAYISTTLSVGTLMTVVFFIGIAAYSAA